MPYLSNFFPADIAFSDFSMYNYKKLPICEECVAYQVIIVEDDPMVAEIDKQYVEHNSKMAIAGIFQNGQEALDLSELTQWISLCWTIICL